jgi:hypothetical protein
MPAAIGASLRGGRSRDGGRIVYEGSASHFKKLIAINILDAARH